MTIVTRSPLTRRSLKGVPVKVVVGADEECFFVHSSVLRKHSEFFDTACKKEWIEGQYRVIKLPEDDSDIFHNYVQWLYTGTIFSKAKDSSSSDNEVFRQTLPDQLRLSR